MAHIYSRTEVLTPERLPLSALRLTDLDTMENHVLTTQSVILVSPIYHEFAAC